MRLTLKTLAMLLVALLPGAAWAAAFSATLDRDTLTLGESATLALAFEGGSPGRVPTPSVPGLQITQAGTSQNMSWINGAMSSTVTVSFSVTPQRPGEFTIPALTANVSGQQLSTQPLKLVVSKANAPSATAVNSGSEVAFLKLTFPKPTFYVGESTVARLELHLRDDVQNFGNFQLNGMPADGFSLGKIAGQQNQRRRVQVGNRAYTVIPYEVPLMAVRTGTLALGPFTGSVVVVLPSQNQGGDPFFRQFFNQGEQKQVTVAMDPVKVESLPLPDQNKPANFTGAIGNYKMTATAGPTAVTVGDPITVRVQISGRGALDALALPAQAAWNNFKTYPPTTKLETSDQFGFQGTKTFEQIISPQNSDVHELPALTFSFFNPEDGQYHTLTQAALPLSVKAAGATPLPQMAAIKSEEKPAMDILPIKESLGTLVASQTPLVTRPRFLALQSLPVLAFFAAFIWRKRADNLANNPRLRRQRAVAALVASGKTDLKKFAAENKPDEFFATLFRLLQEQLGERLDCPATAITENIVEESPILRGAPENLRNALREQFQLCNQARYAPVRGTSELNSVAAQFEKLLGDLLNLKS